jgi:hypothetical protein
MSNHHISRQRYRARKQVAMQTKSERTTLGQKKPRIITDATDRRELSVTIHRRLSKSAVSSAPISPVSI